MAGSLTREAEKRSREKEFYGAICIFFFFFFLGVQNTYISGRLMVYSQPEVNQMEPCCCVLMKMLSLQRRVADALIILGGVE